MGKNRGSFCNRRREKSGNIFFRDDPDQHFAGFCRTPLLQKNFRPIQGKMWQQLFFFKKQKLSCMASPACGSYSDNIT